MLFQLALVVSATLASPGPAVPVEKFGRNDRNDQLKSEFGRSDRHDEPMTVNTGVGESYTCWEGSVPKLLQLCQQPLLSHPRLHRQVSTWRARSSAT